MTKAIFIIYVITHKESGRQYVGQTRKTLAWRWRKHCQRAARGKRHMNVVRAIHQYGPDAFTIELLEQCHSLDELNEREIFWIKTLNTLKPNGFNSRAGGNERFVPAEIGGRISVALRGRKNGPMNAEHRRNISRAHIGKKRSPETRQKIALTLIGRKLSLEHCAKISAMQKGKKREPMSAERRANISAAMKGRTLSPEHRQNITLGLRRWRANFDG